MTLMDCVPRDYSCLTATSITNIPLPLVVVTASLYSLCCTVSIFYHKSISHQRKQVKSFLLHLPLILIHTFFTCDRPLRDVHESSPLNLNIDSIICPCTLRYLLHRPQAPSSTSAWASWAFRPCNCEFACSCLGSLRYCHWCCETNVLSFFLFFFLFFFFLFFSSFFFLLPFFSLFLSLLLSRLRLSFAFALTLLTVPCSCSSWSVNQSSLQVDSTQPVRLIVTLIWFAKLASPLSLSLSFPLFLPHTYTYIHSHYVFLSFCLMHVSVKPFFLSTRSSS